MRISATTVGVFTLGLAVGAMAAPWLPGLRSGSHGQSLTALIAELEADLGPEPVQAAVARARMRLDAAGYY